MSVTTVITPLSGRAIALSDIPDPVFAQGMVGYGAAVEPPLEVVDAVAPVGGKVVKMMPHAYVIMTLDGVGVLVHLGLDTVGLKGEGFKAYVAQGDVVTVGQPMISYDVPSIVAAGLSPIVPVVIMDEREADNIAVSAEVDAGTEIALGAALFTASKGA